MNFSTFNISFGKENPTIIIKGYHMGSGTHFLDKKIIFIFSPQAKV